MSRNSVLEELRVKRLAVIQEEMNILKPELRYSTLFQNARVTNDGDWADFANFDPKIGCHDNVP